MKKFFSLLIVLAMGLSMVSCIQNTESESVKAIRDAKAAELQALAELHKAQAAAEKLLSEAQAALLAAEARYQNAIAEGQELENQKAKATMELEIQKIVAGLEAELAQLLAQIAEYKDDLRDELYYQLTYWMGQLATESANLATLEGQLALLSIYDVADAESDAKIRMEEIQRQIEYNKVIIESYNQFIAANEIDVTSIFASYAELLAEVDVLDERFDMKEDELDDILDYIYDDIEDTNEFYFEILLNTGVLDKNGDDDMDSNEWLIDYHKIDGLLSSKAPIISINQENMALLDEFDFSLALLMESLRNALGSEGDKFDEDVLYEDQTEYALLDYWNGRKNTFESEYSDNLLAAQVAVADAKEVWLNATAENKEAAEKALVAAIDALDEYTMIGVDLDDPDNGEFTLFVGTTYDTALDDYIDPSDPAVSEGVTVALTSGNRTYYEYKETFVLALGFYINEELAKQMDAVVEQNAVIARLETNYEDLSTLTEMVNKDFEYYSNQAKQIDVLYEELMAIDAEVNAKWAEIEAMMNAMLTAEAVENANIAEILKEYVANLEAEIVALENEYIALDGVTPDKALYDSYVRQIVATRAIIEDINKIIDQIEAEMSSLVSVEDSE